MGDATLQVIKRDGRVVDFDPSRVVRAIERCLMECKSPQFIDADAIAEGIRLNLLQDIFEGVSTTATVEDIQDWVEQKLIADGAAEAAKRYILYRAEHAKLRDDRPVPDDVRAAFDESKRYFAQPSQELVYYLNYARWSEEKGRREAWTETVDRAVDFLHELSHGMLDPSDYAAIGDGIRNMEAMPSMRLLAMAGPAARRDSTSIYNCSAMGVSCIDAFVEALLISMGGCGVGFSVERNFVDQLPRIARQKHGAKRGMMIEDSTIGWADALRTGLECWFSGEDVEFDLSLIRPAGAPLKTKGGRASGPEPLRQMLSLIRSKILSRQGGVLTSLDAHDMMCWVGDAAVMGGMRRTAMISLFDADDEAMRTSKAMGFDRENSQRWNANNSAVLLEDVTQERFASDFIDMVKSGNGEPGIFSRRVANLLRPERRQGYPFLTNPCSEIILRDTQFCNLSICVARPKDTQETLARKVQLATMIGTVQSMATHFPYLRPSWKQNCEEERLLGVDITGHYDSPAARDPQVQRHLKTVAIETNKRMAAILGINQSVAVTCVKPSGNSAQLLDVSSGVHPRYAQYYIRRYRVATTSPLYRVLKDAGVPLSPENGQTIDDAVTWVASFPIKSPKDAITRNDISAVEHCEYWLSVRRNYTEHKPSATIYYGPDEIIDLMQWVWNHRDEVDGVTFLPRYDANLQQAPYEEISEAEYLQMAKSFPIIDFSKVVRYEISDHTTASQEAACSSGNCETI